MNFSQLSAKGILKPLDYLLIDLFVYTSIDPINFLGKIEDHCWMAGRPLNIDFIGMEIYLQDRRLDKLNPSKWYEEVPHIGLNYDKAE